ncbi:MAG: trypsin-like serine protease [Desulfobulbaceae bacterium]|nr:trypsin-like serine protease [Desulfobulbaceae bacterium]HIJ89428.1 trypsin-like serine protease [Deltaproteobacteria bacterium]
MIYTPCVSRYDSTGVSNDADWSGVARIHDGLISGSGVLLASGLHLLTVAHLLDDLVLTDSSVVFVTASGTVSRRIQAVENYPDVVINSLGVWHDLALVTLEQAAPPIIDRYGLYTGIAELGQTATLVGYGQAQSPLGVVIPEAATTRRYGENTIDAIATSLSQYGWQGSLADQLLYDYDDGTISRDALGDLLGVANRGLGGSEAMITPGDSGGGLFVEQGGDWLLAGINSFVTRWTTTDITTAAEGSLGDIGAATRVSSYTDWVESRTGQSQAPGGNTTSPPASADVPRQVQEGQGVWFLVQLPGPATQIATADFFTRDGSAVAGQDYIPTHGTLTLDLGEWWAKVWVQTLADNLIEGNETFSLVLTNPHGAVFPAGQIELTAQRTILDDITLTGVTQLAGELFA